MSRAYELGVRAQHLGKFSLDCPYEGHSEGSRSLRRQWMRGYVDALTGSAPMPQPVYRTRCKGCYRVRFTKREYVRARLQSLSAAT